jgi:hypothetical protein
MMKLVQSVESLRMRYGHCTTWAEMDVLLTHYEQLDAEAERRRAEELARVARLPRKLDPCTPSPDNVEEIARLKTLFYKCLNEQVGGRFVVDSHNRELIGNLFFWAIRLEEKCSIDCRKGLLLLGGVGSGKSTLLRALAEFDRTWRDLPADSRQPVGYRTVTARDVCRSYKAEGDDGLRQYLTAQMAFDELGREPLTSSHYGETLHVMQEVLADREELKLMTHLASNLASKEEIGKLYGPHIADRLRDMCNFIEMSTQPSRRGGAQLEIAF